MSLKEYFTKVYGVTAFNKVAVLQCTASDFIKNGAHVRLDWRSVKNSDASTKKPLVGSSFSVSGLQSFPAYSLRTNSITGIFWHELCKISPFKVT